MPAGWRLSVNNLYLTRPVSPTDRFGPRQVGPARFSAHTRFNPRPRSFSPRSVSLCSVQPTFGSAHVLFRPRLVGGSAHSHTPHSVQHPRSVPRSVFNSHSRPTIGSAPTLGSAHARFGTRLVHPTQPRSVIAVQPHRHHHRPLDAGLSVCTRTHTSENVSRGQGHAAGWAGWDGRWLACARRAGWRTFVSSFATCSGGSLGRRQDPPPPGLTLDPPSRVG